MRLSLRYKAFLTEFMALLNQKIKVEVVIDRPHHYRARFFNRLSEELNVRVVYVASNGLERKGLILPDEKRFESVVLGSLLYNEVQRSLMSSAKVCLAAIPILLARPLRLIILR